MSQLSAEPAVLTRPCRPLLLDGISVRATLADLKTQTRLLLNPQPVKASLNPCCWLNYKGEYWNKHGDATRFIGHLCPFGKAGDTLWVREDWCLYGAGGAFVGFKATDVEQLCEDAIYDGWKSPMLLPRDWARLRLEIVTVRAERLQDITEADAIAEGIRPQGIGWAPEGKRVAFGASTPISAYSMWWDRRHKEPKPVRIKGKIDHYVSHPWADVTMVGEFRGKPWHILGNSFVWALTYKKVVRLSS